jgi:hypothetical protein
VAGPLGVWLVRYGRGLFSWGCGWSVGGVGCSVEVVAGQWGVWLVSWGCGLFC